MAVLQSFNRTEFGTSCKYLHGAQSSVLSRGAMAKAINNGDATVALMPIGPPGVAAYRLLGMGSARRGDLYLPDGHFRAVTRVPEMELTSSNSSIKRRTPGSPEPIPPAVLNPSCMAALMSGIPGPLSLLSTWRPVRAPSVMVDSRMAPPDAYRTRLVASSIAARTAHSASSRRRPARSACRLVARATSGTSSEEPIGVRPMPRRSPSVLADGDNGSTSECAFDGHLVHQALRPGQPHAQT